MALKTKEEWGVGLVGAAGRMGNLLVKLLADLQSPGHKSKPAPAYAALRLTGALDIPTSPAIGSDAGVWAQVPALGVPIIAEPAAFVAVSEVIIDFSAPPAIATVLPLCLAHKIPYLVAATALTPAQEQALLEAAKKIPLVYAANFSVGMNVMFALVEQATRKLGPSYDIEISEIHHRFKRDAPSGTALALGKAVATGKEAATLPAVYGRAGEQLRGGASEIGYAALRGGDVSGEHTVFYFGEGERLEITHRSTSRLIFAEGALTAAAWLVAEERAPGLYSMRDVLGL